MTPPAVLGRLVLLAAVAAGWLLGAAGPAAAHPALVSSSPGAGYAVTDSPRAIILTFSEPVSLPDRPLVVRDAEGTTVDLRVGTRQGGAALLGAPARPLPVGAYEVAYRVVGQDGDLIAGTFAFGVATPVGAAGAEPGSVGSAAETVPALPALLRGLLFLGLALSLGGAYVAWRVDEATGGLPGARPLLRTGSVAALVAAVGLLAGLDGVARVLATAAQPGVGQLLGLQALLLAAATVFARRPARGLLAVLMLLLVVALEGARAHPAEAAGLLGSALTVTHLLAGALWLGGLVHVLRLAVTWRGKPEAVRVAAETYARSALVLFVLVTLTGTVSAVVLLPTMSDWTGTTYGRLLLVKIAAFLVVVGLAVAGRARLRRTRAPAAPVAAEHAPRHPLGRPATVETGALAAVVLVAAAVTTLTPARLVPVSALVAAPVGPTARVAERVGQVSVSVVASVGRVDIRADAPDDGTSVAVSLTGQVAGSGGARDLDLTSCGRSCWTGPVDWERGSNVLTLDVTVERYEAGRAAIRVPWPAVPAPGLLARVQEAMGARTAIDTVETVTSGFGVVLPHRSRRTGQEFLSGQPWAEGGATDAVVVEEAGRRTLLFALPALGYHFSMRLDEADRIVSERIVTPNHLLTRDYRYP
jgi:copper transport protein